MTLIVMCTLIGCTVAAVVMALLPEYKFARGRVVWYSILTDDEGYGLPMAYDKALDIAYSSSEVYGQTVIFCVEPMNE